MCLIIDTNIPFDKPQEAAQDLDVFKVLSRKLFSPYRGFMYKKGVIEVINFDLKVYRNYFVHEGLHSFRCFCRATREAFLLNIEAELCGPDMCYFVYKAIIPKGSFYYVGKDDDIVSNKLIIIECV